MRVVSLSPADTQYHEGRNQITLEGPAQYLFVCVRMHACTHRLAIPPQQDRETCGLGS